MGETRSLQAGLRRRLRQPRAETGLMERWSVSIQSALSGWATGTQCLWTVGEHLIRLKCPLPWEVATPVSQPTPENFPRISNYFQGHVAIYHLDAICSEGPHKGMW